MNNEKIYNILSKKLFDNFLLLCYYMCKDMERGGKIMK